MICLEPIRTFNLDQVDPTFHPIGDLSNVMGGDEPNASGRALDIDTALSNAGATSDRYFRVPSIWVMREAIDNDFSLDTLSARDIAAVLQLVIFLPVEVAQAALGCY